MLLLPFALCRDSRLASCRFRHLEPVVGRSWRVGGYVNCCYGLPSRTHRRASSIALRGRSSSGHSFSKYGSTCSAQRAAQSTHTSCSFLWGFVFIKKVGDSPANRMRPTESLHFGIGAPPLASQLIVSGPPRIIRSLVPPPSSSSKEVRVLLARLLTICSILPPESPVNSLLTFRV